MEGREEVERSSRSYMTFLSVCESFLFFFFSERSINRLGFKYMANISTPSDSFSSSSSSPESACECFAGIADEELE